MTRFRNMEIAPACVRGRFVDDAFDESRNARFECVWCDYKTQVSKGLQEHMESCVHGFKDGEYADVGYISKYGHTSGRASRVNRLQRMRRRRQVQTQHGGVQHNSSSGAS